MNSPSRENGTSLVRCAQSLRLMNLAGIRIVLRVMSLTHHRPSWLLEDVVIQPDAIRSAPLRSSVL